MATASNETEQLTIRELTDFSASLAETLRRDPNAAPLHPAVEQALSAECVQCRIKLSGAEILKLGSGEPAGDSKLERLKTGYCARNGCDSHYYRVTRAAHPQLDWPKLLAPAQVIATETQAQAEQAAVEASAVGKRFLSTRVRIAIGAAVLLALLLARHIHMGGTVPFIREPEKFRVDRE